jgi:hypothetical protein
VTKNNTWIMVLATGLVAAGCSSGSVGGSDLRPPASEAEFIGPLDGTNYLIVYADSTGVRWRDTRQGVDSLVLADVRPVGDPTLAWDGSAAAFSYVRRDSVGVGVIRSGRAGIQTVHSGAADGSYTLAFGIDGRLGLGYRSGTGSAMIAVDRDGTVRDMGCRASNLFHAFQGSSNAVVGDGRNVYTVSVTGCGTLTTLPRSGKTDFAFSPDGQRLSFLMSGGQQAGMYIAQVNGAGARRVADAAFNPRNASWSPAGDRVAFEIRSRDHANVTHVAIHDVASGSISFADRERELGVPTDAGPCWSPNGRIVAHERRYARVGATQNYITRQLILKTAATGVETVLAEELLGQGREAVPTCWWIGLGHYVVRSSESFDVIDVTSKETYPIPLHRLPLLIEAFSR